MPARVRVPRVNHLKELRALLKNSGTPDSAIIAKADLALTQILPDPDIDDEDYDLAFVDLAEDIDRARPARAGRAATSTRAAVPPRAPILEQLSVEHQKNIVRSLYVNQVEMDSLSEGMQNLFIRKLQAFKPDRIEDFVALCKYQESEASDAFLDMDFGSGADLDDDESNYVKVREHIAAAIPTDHLLGQILAADDMEAFRYLIKLDKLNIDENKIANLAIDHLEFLNELFVEKYKDDPKPFQDMLEKINLRGNGGQLRDHIDKNGRGLDPEFLDMARKSLQSTAEKDHEDKTAVSIKKLEHKRDAMQQRIDDAARPTLVGSGHLLNSGTVMGGLIGIFAATIAVMSGAYIAAAVLLVVLPALAILPGYQDAKHEQAVFDLDKDKKYKEIEGVNKEIQEQRDLLPDHSENKVDKKAKKFEEALERERDAKNPMHKKKENSVFK